MNEEKKEESMDNTVTTQTADEEAVTDTVRNEDDELIGNTVTTQTADEETAEVAGQTANDAVETTGNHKESPPGDGYESKLDNLAERFGILEAEFESKIKYDRHREKIIDNLHKELQDYKNDLVKSLLRPMIMDIIHTIDNNTMLVNNLKKEESGLDPQELVKQMDEIISELEEILFRQGVEPFNCEQPEFKPEFDPKRQKIVKTGITHDQLKDKTISKRVHNGYEWEGKVLCRERVNVNLYKPGSKDPETNKKEEKE